MKKNTFDVAVVGCGKIGSLYDINIKNPEITLSHCNAFQKNKNFNLLCCIDTDKYNLSKAKKRWNVKKVFNCVKSFSKSGVFVDVISVCTPISEHYKNIKSLVKLRPKIIFCEKPLAKNVNDAKKIISLCNQYDIGLVVNYSRRWDHRLEKFKKDFYLNKFGKLMFINVKFNNGIFNYGSHVVNTLLMIFNDKYKDFREIKILESNKLCAIFRVFFQNIPIYMNLRNKDNFSQFEIEFVFENKEIILSNGGRNWYFRSIKRDDKFKSNFIYSDLKYSEGGIIKSLENAVQNISDNLLNNKKIKSNGFTALQTQILCDKLNNLLK